MIRPVWAAFVALAISIAAHAQTDTAPVRLDQKPMRDGSGVVIGHLLSATNTSDETQCVRARMEPALVSNGGIFRSRLVLKPRQRNVAFARFVAGAHFDRATIYLEPDENCPERDADAR
jgi:hypothetical protein